LSMNSVLYLPGYIFERLLKANFRRINYGFLVPVHFRRTVRGEICKVCTPPIRTHSTTVFTFLVTTFGVSSISLLCLTNLKFHN
jgi:hypothetical protein